MYIRKKMEKGETGSRGEIPIFHVVPAAYVGVSNPAIAFIRSTRLFHVMPISSIAPPCFTSLPITADSNDGEIRR